MEYNLTKKQTEAYLHLTDDKDKAILYGGAKGGGKSYLLCLWAYSWTLQLIEFFGITQSKHPPMLGFIGRKRGVDFNDTTLETFKRVVPYQEYDIRTQEKEIIVNGLAKIGYGGLDDQESINKFNSAEFAFFGIDQAEETEKKDVSVLQGSLRLTINNKTPPYKELFTANPAECWLKDDFIIGNRRNGVFIPALPDDNPYLPINYKQTLRNAFEYDPALLKAYLEGDWDAFSNLEDALIRPIFINKAREVVNEETEEDSLRIIAADVATKHGKCETVVVYRYGHTIKEIKRYKNIPTTQIAFIIKTEYEKHKANVLVVDSDGFGEGVADVLTAQNIGATEFHGGSGYKAIDQKRYRNLRSQFYDITVKKFEKGFYSLKHIEEKDFIDLRRQFCSIKVRPPDAMGRRQIETKEDMMARQVSSPDLPDAIVYSEYGHWVANYQQLGPFAYR